MRIFLHASKLDYNKMLNKEPTTNFYTIIAVVNSVSVQNHTRYQEAILIFIRCIESKYFVM